MSYSKVFSPEKYEVISNVIEAVSGLTPGGSISITNKEPEAMEKTRYLVYDYFHHMGLKSKFRIKMIGEMIVIQRLGFRSESEIVTFGEKFDSSMIERLIELWGEPEAEATLKNWIETKAISLEEGEELWTHVKRIMS
jgi:hypothetical protein